MTPTPAKLPIRRSLGARLSNYFFAGILVTAPIGITIYTAWAVISWVDETVAGVLPARYSPNTYLPVDVPGVGLIMLAVAMTLVGFLTANYLGRVVLRTGERIVNRMPVVRGVYSAVKQIFEAVLSGSKPSFNEVVLVEYPRREMWTLGLVIGESYGEIQEKAKEKLFNVYLPTTPNPTSGYLVFLPRSQMIHLEMSVEDCMKMIVSGGIVTPPYKKGVALPTKMPEEEGPP
ncbi:MAG: DUF502 domain-containing protein [Alphaproteobacteria bacterium]|nr:DUF502 domain-containing protein [Alphaproteobacteria bacterium]